MCLSQVPDWKKFSPRKKEGQFPWWLSALFTTSLFCLTGKLTRPNSTSQAPLPLASGPFQSVGALDGDWGAGGKEKSENFPPSFLF